MHASSMENMQRCRTRFLPPEVLERRGRIRVLDVGGADVNGGYRSIFDDARIEYRTVDIAPGEGVDIVLEDPYRYPLADASVDVVLSGQMLEHCEFFWLAFAEMMRVLKPDGLLFLIAPSAGPIHRYPVDCYRFYPDAYRALAKHAGCHLLETWLDERGPWRDLVGVFSKQPISIPASDSPVTLPLAPVDVAPGTEAEEQMRGDMPYLEFLGNVHEVLKPSNYLEIGVRRGASLRLAKCPALGVDPAPEVEGPLPDGVRLVKATSDDFFRSRAGMLVDGPPDLVFIDGMHLFEFVLRDFMHVERLSSPGTLVVVDDVFPSHPAQAERKRRTRVWTGDVWKLQQCLAEKRGDLVLVPVNTGPTGLLLIAGLNPSDKVLWDAYNPIVRRYVEMDGPPEAVLSRENALSPASPLAMELVGAIRQLRESRSHAATVRKELRAMLAAGGR